MFNEPALNTSSKSLAKRYDAKKYKICKEKRLKTFRLEEVLNNYLPRDTSIDFLSVDIEGFDFQVLNSNNWDKYKPEIILVEDLDFSIINFKNSKIYRFLTDKDYKLLAKTLNTLVFINKKSF